MRSDHTVTSRLSCNSFKRSQLTIQIGEGLFQHLAMAWVARSRKLLSQMLAGKGQTLSFAIVLLLLGRHKRTRIFPLLRSLFLLLFNRLTLPTARHSGSLDVSCELNVEKDLIVTVGWLTISASGKAPVRMTDRRT